MSKNYLFLAKLLRFIIIAVFVLKLLAIIYWWSKDKSKRSTKVLKGYPIELNVRFRIPDSVQQYQSDRGTIAYYRYEGFKPALKNLVETDSQYKKTDLVKNNLRIFSKSTDSVRLTSNGVYTDKVVVMVDTNNMFYKSIWCVKSYSGLLIYYLIAVILLLLLSAYIKGNLLSDSSFKLITLIGVLIISNQLLIFLVAYFNSKLISHGNLMTTINDKYYKIIDIQVTTNWYSFIPFKEVFIGFVIIVLSSVIKTTVEMKKENDLTI